MCDTCGCGTPGESVTFRKHGDKHHDHGDGHHHPDHEHSHEHGHPHDHHGHKHSHDRTINVEQDILGENNLKAQRNRGYFEAKDIFAINLVSSPGSGKTTLLEKTLSELSEIPSAVIEGDQQTMNDADRIAATGVPVLQINTGNGCHLDADMIHTAYDQLDLGDHSMLFIENVGNLVCPALFDLGENKRVVIISVTEGEDKPAKYPDMFDSADICIINKIDLLPYVQFDVSNCKSHALKVNHKLEFFELSATSGEGMEQWVAWLQDNFKK